MPSRGVHPIGYVYSEARQPGVTVAQIAHRYDLDARRISNWKTKFSSGAMVLVEVMPDDDNLSVSADRSSSCIEIDLACGTRMLCGQETSAELVTSVFADACSTWLCADSKYRNVAQWKRTPTLKRSE
jgi:hypothetical protein